MQEFVDYLGDKIKAWNILKPASTISKPANGDDLLAQLERLGQMKLQGLLTDEEFKAAKKKLGL